MIAIGKRVFNEHVRRVLFWGAALSVFAGIVSIVALGQCLGCSSLCGDRSLRILPLIMPQAFLFLALERKSQKIASIFYWTAALLLVSILSAWAFQTERTLFSHVNDEEFFSLDLVKDFLGSGQTLSAGICASVLLFLFLVIICRVRRRLLIGAVMFAGAVTLLISALNIPFPIEGEWSRIGGCMTNIYNFTTFMGDEVVHYNSCAAAEHHVEIGPYGHYKRKAFAVYEWRCEEIGEVTLRSYPLRIKMLNGDIVTTAGFRNLDYFTMSRFRKYAEIKELLEKRKSVDPGDKPSATKPQRPIIEKSPRTRLETSCATQKSL